MKLNSLRINFNSLKTSDHRFSIQTFQIVYHISYPIENQSGSKTIERWFPPFWMRIFRPIQSPMQRRRGWGCTWLNWFDFEGFSSHFSLRTTLHPCINAPFPPSLHRFPPRFSKRSKDRRVRGFNGSHRQRVSILPILSTFSFFFFFFFSFLFCFFCVEDATRGIRCRDTRRCHPITIIESRLRTRISFHRYVIYVRSCLLWPLVPDNLSPREEN